MKREIEDVILEQQKIIAELDARLAMYEKLGTIDELCEKLGVNVELIRPEDVKKPIVERKEDATIAANILKNNKDLLEKVVINKDDVKDTNNSFLGKSRITRIMEQLK